jgi:hypothetical protein
VQAAQLLLLQASAFVRLHQHLLQLVLHLAAQVQHMVHRQDVPAVWVAWLALQRLRQGQAAAQALVPAPASLLLAQQAAALRRLALQQMLAADLVLRTPCRNLGHQQAGVPPQAAHRPLGQVQQAAPLHLGQQAVHQHLVQLQVVHLPSVLQELLLRLAEQQAVDLALGLQEAHLALGLQAVQLALGLQAAHLALGLQAAHLALGLQAVVHLALGLQAVHLVLGLQEAHQPLGQQQAALLHLGLQAAHQHLGQLPAVAAGLVLLLLLHLGRQQAAAAGLVLPLVLRPLEQQQLAALQLQAAHQRLVQEPAAAAAALGQQAVLQQAVLMLLAQQAALPRLAQQQAVVQRSEWVLAVVLDLGWALVLLRLEVALVLLAVRQALVRQQVVLLGLVLLQARGAQEFQEVVLLVPALLRLVQQQAAQEALGHQQGEQAALGLQAAPQVPLEQHPLPVGLAAHLRLAPQPLAVQLQPLGPQQVVLAALALQALLLRSVLVVGLVAHLPLVLAVAVASLSGSKRRRVGGARWLQGDGAPRVDECLAVAGFCYCGSVGEHDICIARQHIAKKQLCCLCCTIAGVCSLLIVAYHLGCSAWRAVVMTHVDGCSSSSSSCYQSRMLPY